ncbi:DNA replication regulator SLD3-domain-containing protein [Myxozyma melibiosi]|uniref:DNA replication regulator SLD3-domain-containing protein n=1 Tax=Myxozyma melibiosi TaxID=54550 RepID=A0ABR1FET9_9ASCO
MVGDAVYVGTDGLTSRRREEIELYEEPLTSSTAKDPEELESDLMIYESNNSTLCISVARTTVNNRALSSKDPASRAEMRLTPPPSSSPTHSSARKRRPQTARSSAPYIRIFQIHPYHESSFLASSVLTITPIKAIPCDCMIPVSLLFPAGATSVSSSPSTSSTSAAKSSAIPGAPGASRAFSMVYPDLEEMILFVKIEEEKALAVVEYLDEDVYMLTHLPAHVKIKDIRALPTTPALSSPGVRRRPRLMRGFPPPLLSSEDTHIDDRRECANGFESVWRDVDLTRQVVSDMKNGVRNTPLTLNFSMKPPTLAAANDTMSSTPITPKSKTMNTAVNTTPATPLALRPRDGTDSPQQQPPKTAHEALKHFQTLYFEALYVSRSPLTFFTKLTLQRFRSLCAGSEMKHTDVLNKMILSVGEFDVKYKSGLPNILLEFEGLYGNDEIDVIGGLPMFSSGDGRAKRGKGRVQVPENVQMSVVGLGSLDLEKMYIQRWWNAEEQVRKMKGRQKKINEIKERETKLQIILLLEILAAAKDDQAHTSSPSSSQHAQSQSPEELTKFTLLLDVLFDRLLIWQAVSSFDFIIQSADNESKTGGVREFAVSVVLPFYGAKLPKETEKMLRKSGGSDGHHSTQKKELPVLSSSTTTTIKTEFASLPRSPSRAPRAVAKRSQSATHSSSPTLPYALPIARKSASTSSSSSLLQFSTETRTLSNSSGSKRKGIPVRGGLMATVNRFSKNTGRRPLEIITGPVRPTVTILPTARKMKPLLQARGKENRDVRTPVVGNAAKPVDERRPVLALPEPASVLESSRAEERVVEKRVEPPEVSELPDGGSQKTCSGIPAYLQKFSIQVRLTSVRSSRMILTVHVIQPCQSNGLSSKLTMTPIKVVSRDMIPISLLLLSTFSGEKSSSRAFSTTGFKGLRNSEVLFVKIEDEKRLGAIEYVQENVYMLTKLPETVKMKMLRTLPMAAGGVGAEQVGCEAEMVQSDFEGFWRRLARPVPSSTGEHHALYNSFSMAPPRTSEMKEEKQIRTETAVRPVEVPESCSLEMSMEELTRSMKRAYYEALYLSRSALTFFTKLGLTRFRRQCGEDSGRIIKVLSQIVMTVGASDEKYRRGLRERLGRLHEEYDGEEVAGMGVEEEEEGGEEEEKYIRRWWDQDEEVRKPKLWNRKIDEIKRRETKMQIILALEILAQDRERRRAEEEKSTEGSSVQEERGHENEETKNLRTLVEVLLDRLYIWQMVSDVESIIVAAAEGAGREKTDEVREFCLQVVVPYFGARLAEEIGGLVERCGGGRRRERKEKREKKEEKKESTRARTKKPREPRPQLVRKNSSAVRGGLQVSSQALERRQVELGVR